MAQARYLCLLFPIGKWKLTVAKPPIFCLGFWLSRSCKPDFVSPPYIPQHSCGSVAFWRQFANIRGATTLTCSELSNRRKNVLGQTGGGISKLPSGGFHAFPRDHRARPALFFCRSPDIRRDTGQPADDLPMSRLPATKRSRALLWFDEITSEPAPQVPDCAGMSAAIVERAKLSSCVELLAVSPRGIANFLHRTSAARRGGRCESHLPIPPN